jgi:hypothetical protein
MSVIKPLKVNGIIIITLHDGLIVLENLRSVFHRRVQSRSLLIPMKPVKQASMPKNNEQQCLNRNIAFGFIYYG